MSTDPQVNYRMLTPLIRIKIKTDKKLHYKINNNLTIIENDPTVFPSWNNSTFGSQTIQILSGMSAMSFNYSPLLVGFFPYVKNYPDEATEVLDIFLTALALFKTTSNTKLKAGPRIVQTLTAAPLIRMLNIRGSDDWGEFQGKEYPLEMSELDDFKNFYNTFEPLFKKIINKKFKFALEFFSKSSRTADVIEKFIFLSLSFEFLFSKENDELSYRFSNRTALLLGDNFTERSKIAKIIKNVIYQKRSSIIHGSNMDPPTEDILLFFNELMRTALLQFISLYDAGYTDPISDIDSFLLKQQTNEYDEFKKKSLSLFLEISRLKFQCIRTK